MRRLQKAGSAVTRSAESLGIAVIIPTFNAADTIVQQLEALARQKLDRPWEVLVCDNGSTDDTVLVARHWIGNRRGFTLIDASHRRGASAARNCGAAVATAPLLAFCDADDIVANGWLAAMVAGLERADAIAGIVESASPTTEGAATVSWTTQAPIRLAFWPRYAAGATNNLAVHSAAFHHIGGFDESLAACEDIDFCWRLQMAGFSLEMCASAVVEIRKREGRRATLRQAYSYGKGEGLLRQKWSDRAARDHQRDARPDGESTEHRQAVSDLGRTGTNGQLKTRLRRVRGVLVRLTSPSQQADLLWRCGFDLGMRVGLRSPCDERRNA